MVQTVHKKPVLSLGKRVVVVATSLKAKTPAEAANAVFKPKSKVDTKDAGPASPAVEAKQLTTVAAEDGPPLAAELPEHHRGRAPWGAQRTLTEQQLETIYRIIQRAGHGHRKTLGLRLVLAASEDEAAGAWPIGLLAKMLAVAGYATASHAVSQVMQGVRVSRYREMARNSIEVLNKKATDSQ
jgi:hypothetical protein